MTPSSAHRAGGLTFVLFLALSAVVATPSVAALSKVTAITFRETRDEIQAAILTTGPVRYQLRNVRPNWVVIDILSAELGSNPLPVPGARELVQRIRVAQHDPEVVRVVVELAQPANFHLTTSLDPAAIIVGIPRSSGPASPKSGPALSAGMTPATQKATRLIVTGRSIGPVRLGMTVEDVVKVLGPSTTTERVPNGDTDYRWSKSAGSAGFGVRASSIGIVNRIWILNDESYVLGPRLHVGSTEADARAILGHPSWVVTIDSQTKRKTLMYESRGVWVNIQLDPRAPFYNRIFEIDIMHPK